MQQSHQSHTGNAVVCVRCGQPVVNFPGWLARTNIKAICDQCRSGHPSLEPSTDREADASEKPSKGTDPDSEADTEATIEDEPLELETEDEGIALDDTPPGDGDDLSEDT